MVTTLMFKQALQQWCNKQTTMVISSFIALQYNAVNITIGMVYKYHFAIKMSIIFRASIAEHFL